MRTITVPKSERVITRLYFDKNDHYLGAPACGNSATITNVGSIAGKCIKYMKLKL